MRFLFVITLLAALTACATSATELSVPPQSDILIKNGTVIDGSGSAGRKADVLISGGMIAAVGKELQAAPDAKIIDATGKVVTPGFIDPHAHGNPSNTPDFNNFITQGVTTICLGQDGSSPSVGEMAEWMNAVETTGSGPNIILYAGHGTIRREAGVGEKTNPSPSEIKKMAELSDTAMKLGCFGLTTGLEYRPGLYASMDELAAIGKPVGEHGGIIMSHMRTEDDDKIEEALEELIEQGRRANTPVHVSHIKSVYGRGTGRAEEIIQILDEARTDGQQVTADLYPYTASHTTLEILFPEWAKSKENFENALTTRRDELEEYLRNRVTLRNGPEATLLSTEPYQGKTLAELAEERGKPFEQVLIDLTPQGGSAAYFVMDKELQGRLLQAPFIMVCSDGSPTMHHPRGHGSFPKIIRDFVNERQLLTLEEAIHKMSGLTAETIRLTDQQRGLLKVGWAADVLVFDPRQLKDEATFEEPHMLATGMDYVIVNGEIAQDGGRHGRMLRMVNTPRGESTEFKRRAN